MAHSTLPALPTSGFPQSVLRIVAQLDAMVLRSFVKVQLGSCEGFRSLDQSGLYGDTCRREASVFHRASEQHLCMGCFELREGSRG